MYNKIIRTAVMTFLVALILPIMAFAAIETKTDTSSVPGWSTELSKADGGATIDTSEKFSGDACMKMENHAPADNGGYLRVSYPVSVKPNHTYKYGFRAKVKNASGAYAQINWIRTALGYLNPLGNTADWCNFEFAYANNSTDTTAYLRFILEKGAEIVWIDDVYFYDTSLPETPENNLISNPSFEGISTAAQDSASKDIIPVINKKDISIDGDISEWKDVKPYDIEIYTDYSNEKQTVSGNIRYAWDNDNFYFVIDAEDDVHYTINSGSYWNGDGLQFTICGTGESFGTAYGLVYNSENGEIIKFGDTAIDAAASRNGTKTIYEVAIPWSAYFSEIPSVALFCAIVNDNDNDGMGRRGCIDVAPGISMYKGSQLFPKMMFLKENEEFAAFFQGTADIDVGKEATYSVDLFNQTNSDKTVSVTSKNGNLDTNVTIKPFQSTTYEFSKVLNDYGTFEMDIKVTDGKSEFNSSAKTEVCPNVEMTKNIIAKHKKNFSELSSLMGKCEAAEIPIEYQKVKYYTIDIFINYLEEDLADNDLTRISHQDKVLTQLYNEAKQEFEELISGERAPVSVPRYITSPITVNGKHFEATTQREDGTKETRPVFFVGAGHWAQSRNVEEVEAIHNVGFNCMQPEIGPWDAMVEARSVKEWSMKVIGKYDINDTTSDTVKKSGSRSLKITSSTPWVSNNYCYFRQVVNVNPNTTYEYGLSCKGTNVKQVYYSVADIGVKDMRKYLTGTYDWRDEKNEFTTGSNQTTASFIILVEDTVEALYIDDVFICEKGTENNLLKNGGFEETYPEGQYYAMDEYVVNSLENTFAACDRFNISGKFSAAPHYVPKFLIRDYPDVELSEQYGNFSKQNPYNPKLQEMYEIFYKSLIPRIKDYESFDGVVLANEPQFNTWLSKYAFIDDFRAEMQKKYGTIEALNAQWGTEYASFADVDMPSSLEATPRFYDWRVYNDKILPEWIGYISKFIKDIDPDIFTSVKVMDTFGRTTNFRVTGSNNYEVLKDYTDINGCDAWSLIDTYDVRWKNVFYDFLTSVKDAPVYNTEDHIIIDANVLKYRDTEVKYNAVDIWTGAIHGRGGSVMWIWDRSSRTKNGTIYFNSLLTARPDSVASLGKTALDLSRLSKEIVAIQEAPANVGILYSQNTIPYSDEMLDIIYSVSASLGENGQKTKFVVESESEKMFDYGTLIIPNSKSITEQTLNNIKRFIDNGGNLFIIGDDSLTLNEYGKKHNESLVSYIKSKAKNISFEDAGTAISGNSKNIISKEITKLVENNGYDIVKVIDKSTGEKIKVGDWIAAEYEDSYIISLCNYEWNTKETEIYINGKKVEQCEDLINFNKYGDTVTVEGYVPLLLKVSK